MNFKKVLIVDNEEQIAERLSRLLGAFGWRVVTAFNGKDALKKVKKYRPDAIVLDMIMPEMDGFQVARSLKSHPKYRRIPIVAATSLSRPVDRVRCLAAGCDDYVRKPFTVEQLQRRLLCLLQAHLPSVGPSETTQRRLQETDSD